MEELGNVEAREVVRKLESALVAFDALPLSRLTDKELLAYTRLLGRHLDVLRARFFLCVDDVDARDAAVHEENVRTYQWLAFHLRLRSAEASGIVNRVKDLRCLPRTRREWSEGLIGEAQTRAMTIGVRKTHGDDRDQYTGDEELFLNLGRDKRPEFMDALRQRALAYLRDAKDDADHKDAELLSHRGLRWTRGPDGELSIEWNLDPVGTGTFLTVVDALTPPPVEGETRTAAQRRSDGLIDGLNSLLDNSAVPRKAGQRPHVVMVASTETINGHADAPHAEMEGVGPIARDAFERIQCDCAISYVLSNSRGEPVNVGREHRLATEAQRRAITARDKHCRYRGCYRPSHWCEVHHLKHWKHGGNTDIRLMVLYCRWHHGIVHREGADIIHNDDGTMTFCKPGTIPGAVPFTSETCPHDGPYRTGTRPSIAEAPEYDKDDSDGTIGDIPEPREPASTDQPRVTLSRTKGQPGTAATVRRRVAVGE